METRRMETKLQKGFVVCSFLLLFLSTFLVKVNQKQASAPAEHVRAMPEVLPICLGKNLTAAQQVMMRNVLGSYLATWRGLCSLVCNFRDPLFINYPMNERLFLLKKMIDKLDANYEEIKRFYLTVGCPEGCCMLAELAKNHQEFLTQILMAN